MLRVIAVALLGAVATLWFKQYKPEWGTPLRLMIGVILGGMVLTAVGEIVAFGHDLAEGYAVTREMWTLILKALGIAFMTEIASGVCRDCGETSMAAWVEMAGRLTLLLMALPLIGEVLLTAKELVQMGG